MNGEGLCLELETKPGGVRQPGDAVGQAVAQVNCSGGRVTAAEGLAEAYTGLRLQVACHAGMPDIRGLAVAGPEQVEPDPTVAEDAADEYVIARTSPAAGQQTPPVRGADERDVHRERAAGAGDVA